MKRIFSIILSLFMMFNLTGCMEQSKKEINVYTAIEEEYLEKYLSAFKREHPDIKINLIRDSGGVVSSKLLIEKDNPRADVVWGIAASNVLVLDKYNIFEPYAPSNLNEFHENFYDREHDVPHWCGISGWMNVITVNEKELQDKDINVPTNYEELLNSDLKESLIMPNPASSGTGYLIVAGLIQMMGEEEAWKYMDKLDENMKEYSHSGTAPIKQTAQGEALAGIGADYTALQMQKDNTQIKTIFPKEGSGWDLDVAALVKKDNIKDEAKIFYEWLLSNETMKMYAENRTLIPLKGYTSELAKKFNGDINSQMINNNLVWASENRNRILKEWEKRYGVGD